MFWKNPPQFSSKWVQTWNSTTDQEFTHHQEYTDTNIRGIGVCDLIFGQKRLDYYTDLTSSKLTCVLEKSTPVLIQMSANLKIIYRLEIRNVHTTRSTRIPTLEGLVCAIRFLPGKTRLLYWFDKFQTNVCFWKNPPQFSSKSTRIPILEGLVMCDLIFAQKTRLLYRFDKF